MKQELIETARFKAAQDIAHRWFAFIDGDTEDISTHVEIFSDDVKLVHAGIHTLADNKSSLVHWLQSLPNETEAHFIREFDIVHLEGNMAELSMRLSYQILSRDGTAGGALSEYKTRVRFDDKHNAVFTFLQKTPQYANPDKVFKDSFPENRMYSFISHIQHLMLTSRQNEISELLSSQDINVEALSCIRLLQAASLTDDMTFENINISDLTFTLVLVVSHQLCRLRFQLSEQAGRYLRIQSINID